jgi:hypothetical protein
MMKRVILIHIFALTALICTSQTVQMSNSRQDYHMHLTIDADMVYEATIKESQYIVMDSIIQIYPGEKLFVEAEFKKGSQPTLKVVSNVVDNNKTMTLVFLQESSDKKHKQMVLTIDNPFEQKIGFNAILSKMVDITITITPNLTVPAKSISTFTWPDILTSILLKSLTLK